MKKYAISALLTICMTAPVLSMAAAPASFEEKLSYSMGYEIGINAVGVDIQKEQMIAGIEDAFKGTPSVLTAAEMDAVKKEFTEKMQAKQMAAFEQMKTTNMAAGEAFLAENKNKEGVVVTPSGLQYQVLKEGTGDKALAEDTVRVEYTGTLIDGTEFDSSAQHDGPVEFKVGQVIRGWSEALQLMNPGTKMHIVIPTELAYGEQGVSPVIEPNSVLVFDVELMEIVKEKKE